MQNTQLEPLKKVIENSYLIFMVDCSKGCVMCQFSQLMLIARSQNSEQGLFMGEFRHTLPDPRS